LARIVPEAEAEDTRLTLWEGADGAERPALVEIFDGYWEGRWWVRCDCCRPEGGEIPLELLWQEGEQQLSAKRQRSPSHPATR
jgi:hypothetical protein